MKRAKKKKPFPFAWSFAEAIRVISVTIVAADLLTYLHPVFGYLGLVGWIGGLGVLAYLAVTRFAGLARAAAAGKSRWVFGITCLVLAAVIACAFSEINFNKESIQEAPCALERLAQSGAGFHSLCHYGYPTRGYYLGMLPLLFSHTISALNLGMALYLVLGLLWFAAGLPVLLGDKRRGDLLGALVLVLLPQFYVVIGAAFSYEQVVFPVAWGMVLCAAWTYFERYRRPEDAAVLGLLSLQLAFSYTPVLPLLGLELIGLVFLCYRRPKSAANTYLRTALVIAVVATGLSLAQRLDMNLFSVHFPSRDRSEVVRSAFSHLFLQDQGAHVVSWPAHLATILLLIAALAGRLGARRAVVAGWAIATIGVGLYAGGVSYIDGVYGFFRILAVAPVLGWLAAGVLDERFPKARWANSALTSAIVALGAWSVLISARTLQGRERPSQLSLLREIESHLPPDFARREIVIAVQSKEDPRGDFNYLNGLVRFVWPESRVELDEVHCRVPASEARQQLRVSYVGYRCSIPGASEELGTFEYLGTPFHIERLRD